MFSENITFFHNVSSFELQRPINSVSRNIMAVRLMLNNSKKNKSLLEQEDSKTIESTL